MNLLNTEFTNESLMKAISHWIEQNAWATVKLANYVVITRR